MVGCSYGSSVGSLRDVGMNMKEVYLNVNIYSHLKMSGHQSTVLRILFSVYFAALLGPWVCLWEI